MFLLYSSIILSDSIITHIVICEKDVKKNFTLDANFVTGNTLIK